MSYLVRFDCFCRVLDGSDIFILVIRIIGFIRGFCSCGRIGRERREVEGFIRCMGSFVEFVKWVLGYGGDFVVFRGRLDFEFSELLSLES